MRALAFFPVFASLVLFSAPANASQPTGLEAWQATADNVVEQYPAIEGVLSAIREDCLARDLEDDIEYEQELCSCGAALTLSMWLANEPMVERLEAYLADPTEETRLSFVNYQGPELYAGACALELEE